MSKRRLGRAVQAEGERLVPLVPVGTGLLMLGGRRKTVEDNDIFGNYAVGAAAIEGFVLAENPQARALEGNLARGNDFGLGGSDRNGRDLAYDGNGTGNCFGPKAGVAVTIPADGTTFAPCPFSGANAFNADAQGQMVALAGPAAVNGWIKHPHAPKPGYEPLEVYEP